MHLLVYLYNLNLTLTLDWLNSVFGNPYIKIALIIINIIISIYISWYIRTSLIEYITYEIPITLINLVHAFSFMSILSVTHILGEYNGISYMMPFGGGNPTGGNSVTGNPVSGNPVASGNPASGNQGGNVGENQLIHQGGNQRGNRRGNQLIHQGGNQRGNRRGNQLINQGGNQLEHPRRIRRRGNLLVTRNINPILSQENELRRISQLITQTRTREANLALALSEGRYVGDFFQGRYVINTNNIWSNPNHMDYYMGRNPPGVDPNFWGQGADEWGHLRPYDPYGQALRGYTLQGVNQPILRHMSSSLLYEVLRTNKLAFREDMFTKEQLNFFLDFLEDKRPDLYSDIMDNPMPSGKPRWSKLLITSDLCTSLREG
jgi:hypothetical protein